MILDAAGNLYGTSIYGGTDDAGTVFELSPTVGGGWTEKVLYSFTSIVYDDGAFPHGSLIFDAAGNLYGTTDNGGPYCFLHQGCGTVFELSPGQGGSWSETVLYSFSGGDGTGDGANPLGGLIFDAFGNVYGTTFGGGLHGQGTVFELTPTAGGSWTESVLYSFGPLPDGQEPWAGLILDTAGNLYGTTSIGGAYTYYGTVFRLTPDGNGSWTETLLHSFGDDKDAADPAYVSLISDAAGNLYGTTSGGGVYNGGTVFEFSPDGSGGWTETLLHSFPNNRIDGYSPYAGLTFDSAGNLYGTTNYGGTYREGTAFELSLVPPCTSCSLASSR